MSAVTHILISLKSRSITQAQAAAEIEELIELERVQLRDTFAAAAPIGVADANDAFYREHGRNARMQEMLDVLANLRGLYADAMLKERAATCTKSQTLAHYGEQARLAAQEGGAA